MTRTLAVAVTLALAITATAAEPKGPKRKEKRFDLVTLKTVAAAEGNYRGVDDSHILELRTAPDGFIGTMRFRGRTAKLTDLSVTERAVLATVTWPDGREETLRGRFVNRVLNGQKTFGLLTGGLHLDVEGVRLENLFFAKVSP